MSNKSKAYSLLFITSILFYMAADTKYMPSLSDHVFKYIGLSPMSNGNQGLHISAIVFILLALGSLLLSSVFAAKAELKFKNRLMVFVLLMSSFALIHNSLLEYKKSNLEGLLAIEYVEEDSHLNYSVNNLQPEQFYAKFELINHSKQRKSFSIAFNHRYQNLEGIEPITVLNKDKSIATFHLESEESKVWFLDFEDYTFDYGSDNMIKDSSGYIDQIILFNSNEKVFLYKEDWFGTLLETY